MIAYTYNVRQFNQKHYKATFKPHLWEKRTLKGKRGMCKCAPIEYSFSNEYQYLCKQSNWNIRVMESYPTNFINSFTKQCSATIKQIQE